MYTNSVRGVRRHGNVALSHGTYRNRGPTAIEKAKEIVMHLNINVKNPDTICNRIYVGNISRGGVQREHIYKEFAKFGEIVALGRLICANGSDSAFTFVEFSNPESAENAAAEKDGEHFYGCILDVKLAEFRGSDTPYQENPHLIYSGDPTQPVFVTNNAAHVSHVHGTSRPAPHAVRRMSVQTHVSSRTVNGMAAKRTSSEYQHARPKRVRQAPETQATGEVADVPDILVCGNCHQNFSDIEIMINHKRRPCQPKVKCRCKADNVPDVITCAICFKELASPWALILHIHKIHSLRICNNVKVEGSVSQEVEVPTLQDESPGGVGNHLMKEDGEDVIEGELNFDPENDLMDDDEAANASAQ